MECVVAAVSDFAYVDRVTSKTYVLGVVRYIMARSVRGCSLIRCLVSGASRHGVRLLPL